MPFKRGRREARENAGGPWPDLDVRGLDFFQRLFFFGSGT